MPKPLSPEELHRILNLEQKEDDLFSSFNLLNVNDENTNLEEEDEEEDDEEKALDLSSFAEFYHATHAYDKSLQRLIEEKKPELLSQEQEPQKTPPNSLSSNIEDEDSDEDSFDLLKQLEQDEEDESFEEEDVPLTPEEEKQVKEVFDLYDLRPKHLMGPSNNKRIYRLPKFKVYEDDSLYRYADFLRFSIDSIDDSSPFLFSANIPELMEDVKKGRSDYPGFEVIRRKLYYKGEDKRYKDQFKDASDYLIPVDENGNTLLSYFKKKGEEKAYIYPYGKENTYGAELEELVLDRLSEGGGKKTLMRKKYGPIRHMPPGKSIHLIDARAKDVERYDLFNDSLSFSVSGKALNLKEEDFQKILPFEPKPEIIKKALGQKEHFIRVTYNQTESYETSESDRDLIMFLGLFRYAPPFILKNIEGITENQIRLQLERLQKIGLVRPILFPGLGDIWVNTLTGQNFCYSPLKTIGYGLATPKPSSIVAMLFPAFVASFLYKNRANVLHLKDFPYQGLPDGKGGKRPGEIIISESLLRKRLRDQIRIIVDPIGYGNIPYKGYIMEQLKKKKEEIFLEATTNHAPSPELLPGNEFLFAVFPNASREDLNSELERHLPDLIVKRPRNENGEPESLAIEVERKREAKVEDFANVFNAYKADFGVYKRIVWIVDSLRVKNKITEGAQLAKFRNYDILPFMDETGPINFREMWFRKDPLFPSEENS